jgi:hypothetical protein
VFLNVSNFMIMFTRGILHVQLLSCFVYVYYDDVAVVLGCHASNIKTFECEISLHSSMCDHPRNSRPRVYLARCKSMYPFPLTCANMCCLMRSKTQTKKILHLRGGSAFGGVGGTRDEADQAMIDEARKALQGRDIQEVTESTARTMQQIEQELDENEQIQVKVPGGSIPMFREGMQVNWTRGDSPPPPPSRSSPVPIIHQCDAMHSGRMETEY